MMAVRESFAASGEQMFGELRQRNHGAAEVGTGFGRITAPGLVLFHRAHCQLDLTPVNVVRAFNLERKEERGRRKRSDVGGTMVIEIRTSSHEFIHDRTICMKDMYLQSQYFSSREGVRINLGLLD